ncbi:MAG: S-layer homology domain-containing protein [Clostridiales bacterium]|nr:S-layer homology domain-containing protein [Clostridiales bacterium]
MLNKRYASLLLAAIMLLGSVQSAFGAPGGPDYAGHWSQTYMEYSISRGYMSGYEDNTYRPDNKMTRAEYSVMLWNALGKPKATTVAPFKDVLPSDWFAAAVNALYERKITYGLSATEFGPHGQLTREMGIVMLVRAFEIPADPSAKGYLEFSDGAKVSDWARAAISAYYAYGLVSGYGNKLLSPDGLLTRAELAVLLYRTVTAAETGVISSPSSWKTVEETPTAAPKPTPVTTAVSPSYPWYPSTPSTPSETASPTPTPTPANVAFRRAAWHSSAANYENTGHLATDGIIGELSPNRINYDVSTVPGPPPYYTPVVNSNAGKFTDETPVNSEWISAGSGEEWVYIDLGADTELQKVIVHWGSTFASKYSIQTSADAKSWSNAATGLAGAAGEAVETDLSGTARYIRILCETASGGSYTIEEIEVIGTNGLEPFSVGSLPDPESDGTQYLIGGNWKVQRASEVDAEGEELAGPDYDDEEWLAAVVPGTILSTYLQAGAIPDPNYDDWQFQVSDTFFTADFWYRDSFDIPASKEGQTIFLNFDSINWLADVYFNGELLPNSDPAKTNSIEGAFIRGKFDVTNLANVGGTNYLAVKIYKNETPGLVTVQGLAEGPLPNGGLLGTDNPTLHAAVGWDWIPTIRGRDIGIFEDVFVSYSGGLELLDPWIETDLDIEQVSENLEAVSIAQLLHVAGPTATASDAALGIEPPASATAAALAVILDGKDNTQWVSEGLDGETFVLEFDQATTVGSLQIQWGTETGAAAAEFESRYPARFKVESTVDGVAWDAFDMYPGGMVPFFGMEFYLPPSPGTAEYVGLSGVNVVDGPAADFYGFMKIPSPRAIKAIRVTILEQNVYGGSIGFRPTSISEFQVYLEDAAAVGTSRTRYFSLDDSKADLTLRTEVHNSSSSTQTATVKGIITPGNIAFSKDVTVGAGQTVPVEISGIVINNPDLWWPNTYGDQPLYTADLEVIANGSTSNAIELKFGVREFTYPIDGGLLSIYCNGTRILAKGGNWGMDDALKQNTAEDYDNKVRLHAEENYTMIRNWVGMTNNKAFYEACDKYGILIWDDFWLANPVDGPDPAYPDRFLDNAIDKIKRIRAHTALALYCGRNESAPPAYIDAGLAERTELYDGTRIYFPNSAGAPVGSGGGYSVAAMPNGVGAFGPNDPSTTGIKEYFNEVPNVTLRSECGIPNVPTLESMMKFLPEEKLWPINESWALHDWTYHMNGPANSYMDALKLYSDRGFITPIDNVNGQNPDPSDSTFIAYKAAIQNMVEEVGEKYTLEEFMRIADMINYENFKGVYEGITVKKSNGFLMWMSQSSWPSFMWQTYDYYLDTNAGYFGAKAANQATHAVWDPRDDTIVLSNMTPKTYTNVVTEAKVYDLNGNFVYAKSYLTPSLGPDTYGLVIDDLTSAFEGSLTPIVFIKLTVKDSAGAVLGDNFYWHNKDVYMQYESLNTMPYVTIQASSPSRSTAPKTGNELYTITLTNSSSTPALLTRVKTISSATGEQVLPAFYSDNYFALVPGESKTITIEFAEKYLEGGSPEFSIEGWNTNPRDLN